MQPQNKGPGMLWGQSYVLPMTWGVEALGPPFVRHAALWLFHYTGPVQVLLLNFGHQGHTIEANNHIAQLILERIAYPILCEVPQMPQTECGAQGFGSTGQ